MSAAQRARERRATDPVYRAKRNAALARWKAKPESPMKVFAWYLRRTYGLSLEQHADMLAEQGGKCAICAASDPGIMTRSKMNRWNVDHDHKTGKVRGLLCGKCNIGLGAFDDNVVSLRNAQAYLEKHSGE